jgi:probable rRNA maturation factor
VLATALGQELGRPRDSLTLLLTDDAGIRELNRRFLGIDRATDVLSFPSGEQDGPAGYLVPIRKPGLAAATPGAGHLASLRSSRRRPLRSVSSERELADPRGASWRPDFPDAHYLGDLAISVETARRQAQEAGHALADEAAVLLLHGVLHLLGHDHETDGGRMRRLETRIARRLLGGASGLIHRTRPARTPRRRGAVRARR